MKDFKLILQVSLFALVALTIFSCGEKGECDYKSKYIYEPIVFDETCNCMVSGKVKYLKDCQTAALVDYGKGTCDNIAIKIICKDGDCKKSGGAITEEFEIDCKEKTIVEGPISEEEALAIGI